MRLCQHFPKQPVNPTELWGEAPFLPSTIQEICLVHQELTNRLDIHQDTVMTQVYLSRRLCGVFNTEAHHDLRA
jgi:hypothetical protein